MYNKLIGKYDCGKYGDIIVRYSDINGMYQLSGWIHAMGDDFVVRKQYDTFDDAETVTDFLNYMDKQK